MHGIRTMNDNGKRNSKSMFHTTEQLEEPHKNIYIESKTVITKLKRHEPDDHLLIIGLM